MTLLHLQIYFPATAGTIHNHLKHYGDIVSTVIPNIRTLNLNRLIS